MDTCTASVYGACEAPHIFPVLSPYSALSLVQQRIHAVRQSTRLSGRILDLSRQCRKPCRVSWGVWRKVSSPEVLRLLFCERRMRCGFVWCSSYSSQWTGQVPGSCFLDKDVDVPVLATSWGCRAHHGYGELMGLLFRAVCTGTRPGLTPATRAG